MDIGNKKRGRVFKIRRCLFQSIFSQQSLYHIKSCFCFYFVCVYWYCHYTKNEVFHCFLSKCKQIQSPVSCATSFPNVTVISIMTENISNNNICKCILTFLRFLFSCWCFHMDTYIMETVDSDLCSDFS